MALSDWLVETKDRFHELGFSQALYSSYSELWMGLLRRVGRVANYGNSIHEYDWDLLIILDACRSDAIYEVESDYSFITSDSIYSNSSTSWEWIEKNLEGQDMKNTAYITANPNATRIDYSRFGNVDHVWEYGYSDDHNVTPPRAVTDAAIRHHRRGQSDRLIVHYMQPHLPLLGLDHPPSLWKELRDGRVNKEATWKAYIDTLRWVLDDVEILLENIDAEHTVITADHAELMGEWDLYGHGEFIPVPKLKRVPYIETSATDSNTYEPPSREKEETPDKEEQLQDLGYL